MTELKIQEEIKEVLENSILPNISLFEKDEVKVYLQDIPLSADYDTDDEDDEKYFPCCIVKLCGGEVKTASDPQTTIIEIMVVIKDWSADMSGYQSLVIMLDRIRDHFLSECGIFGKARLQYPLKFNINENVAAPFFVGSVTTRWTVDVMPYRDYTRFL